MINEDTLDIDGSVAGIRRLHEVGCDCPRHRAEYGSRLWLKSSKIVCDLPVALVADVHHNGMKTPWKLQSTLIKCGLTGLYVFESPKRTH